MGLITRQYGPNAKGSKLSIQEMDNNLLYLNSLADYSVTNQFYVDPARDNSGYEATGNAATPFASVNDALTFINAGIANNTIQPGENNPIFIILMGDTTENVVLNNGHIFLTSQNGNIHQPIYFTGTIHVEGGATGPSALDNNHFSITGLTITPPANEKGIHFTGVNPQRLMLQSVWLQASGTAGSGLYADNTGVRSSDGKKSSVHGSDIKVSHNGTGDVYCFDIRSGSADFSLVETSGATQVGAVSGTGNVLSFTNSQLEANGEVCVESYSGGVLSLTNTSIVNTNTGTSHGIWLHHPNCAAIVGQCYFDVRSGLTGSRAVNGITGTILVQASNLFAKTAANPLVDTNRKISKEITKIDLAATFQSV